MNPLNPWVALIEIVILLSVAFGLGRGIAWIQFRRRIQAQQRAIRSVRHELKRFKQAGHH